VELGPQTFTRQDHIKVVYGPEQMIEVPPRNYCIIENSDVRGAKGERGEGRGEKRDDDVDLQ
jgi:hypothetical protein